MYRIGEFSYLCSMSIKTLRYYDKIGVLTPERVDELTGYRYYSIDQLEQAQKIKSLQEASFTLEEIKSILEGKNTEILLSKEKQIRKEEILAPICVEPLLTHSNMCTDGNLSA